MRKTTAITIILLISMCAYGALITPPAPNFKNETDRLYWQLTIVNECIVERHFEDAQNILEKYLKKLPQNPVLNYYMYKVLKLRGMDEQAKEYQEKTINLIKNTKSLDSLLAKVYMSLSSTENNNILKKEIELTATKHPTDYRVYIAGGHFYMAKKMLPESIKNFNKAVKLAPWLAQIHNLLGYLYTYAGEYEKAVSNLEDYARLFPHQANPHDNLGEIYLVTGHYKKAIKEFKKALKLSPTFFYAREHLIRAYEATGQYKKAIREGLILWEQSDSDDRSAYALSTLGEICMLNGDFARSESKINSALKTRPGWPYYLYQKALLYLYEGKLDKARNAIFQLKNSIDNIAFKHRPEMKQEHTRYYNFAVARYNMALGNFDTAISILDRLRNNISIPQKSIDVLKELAEAYFASGKFQASQNFVNKILKINPNHAPTLLLAAKLNLTLSNKKKARENLKKCLKVLENSDKDAPLLKEALKLSKQLEN